MPAVPKVTRSQVLAHRVRTHGLDRTAATADDLLLVDLGVLDTGPVGAAGTLVARLGDAGLQRPDDWVRVWSVRGAPHWHRSSDLLPLARALWPADAADAGARLLGVGTTLKKAGLDPLEELRTAAAALREVVVKPTAKGDASAAVTRSLPPEHSYDCRICKATHVHDHLMRMAALPAGLRLEPDTSPPVLARIPRWPGVPKAQAGAADVVDAYLRLHGPATPAAVAAYLQTSQRALTASWPDDLAEVRVDGTAMWLPEDDLPALLEAPAPELVRLLPSCDPWILARDRDLVLPETARHKAMWPVIGPPGAVLVDGEVVGTWRTKAAAKHLGVEVAPFGRLTKATLAAIDDEAALVARARGADEARVRVASS